VAVQLNVVLAAQLSGLIQACPGTAEAVVTVRILRQVLLVIVFRIIEFRCIQYPGRHLTIAFFGQLLLVKTTGYFGGFSLFSLSGAFKYGADIGSHPQYLAANVVVTLKTTLLLGISLVV
jgi:hypothetical protein